MKLTLPMKLILNVSTVGLLLQGFVALRAEAGSQWFKNPNCAQLEINDSALNRTLHISDSSAINKLMKRIESMSAEGNTPVQVDATKEIDLTFSCGSSNQTIQNLDGHFKTPSGKFNFDGKDAQIEYPLNKDLQSLLEPALNQKTFKVKGLNLQMSEFVVTYNGDSVSIKNGLGEVTTVKAPSGQATMEANVSGSKLSIKNLDADHFVVN